MEKNVEDNVKGGGMLPIALFVVGIIVLLVIVKLFVL